MMQAGISPKMVLFTGLGSYSEFIKSTPTARVLAVGVLFYACKIFFIS